MDPFCEGARGLKRRRMKEDMSYYLYVYVHSNPRPPSGLRSLQASGYSGASVPTLALGRWGGLVAGQGGGVGCQPQG